MSPRSSHHLPPPFETALQRLKLAAREAVECTVESLGLTALSATQAFQRDSLLGAQFELKRKNAVFAMQFSDALQDRLLQELRKRQASLDGAPSQFQEDTDWTALALVNDEEVEALISADRLGRDIGSGCEWELRELDAYMGALLPLPEGETAPNPLRPELVGHALLRAIQAVTDRPEVQKLLSAELARSMAGALRKSYGAIVADWRNAGLQPASLSVRHRAQREVGRSGRDSHSGAADGSSESSSFDASTRTQHGQETAVNAAPTSGSRGNAQPAGRSAALASWSGAVVDRAGDKAGEMLGPVDPALMSVLRRLASHPDAQGGASALSGGQSAGAGAGAGDPYAGQARDGGEPMLPNLIRAHREELRQASQGAMDHLVIDVIGFLFDQILSDPKVPPQMARLLARLQLPVLRAALGDPRFFASRKHPVRRFVNRIASLGSAFEDFNDEAAQAFMAKVEILVREVVEGDFDQIAPYEIQLAALEAFVAEQSQGGSASEGRNGVAELLARKEDELRLRQLYAERLGNELKDISAPPFLREFVAQVWSRVLLRAAEREGTDGTLAQRLRQAGCDLLLSVQPKPTAAMRKKLLADLPPLMQQLTAGMDLVAWPQEERRVFFGQLMPAHGEALKSASGSALDTNLLSRQLESALAKAPPSREEMRQATHLPVLSDAISVRDFSSDEVQQVGLLKESMVDWKATLDIDLSDAAMAEGAAAANETAIEMPGLPALLTAADSSEAAHGAALADQVQLGFAYRMHLDGKWQKVRLSHVSSGRSFFIFTHGLRQRKTVSMTYRMLQRLCESARLSVFEQSGLIERATARARRQLSALAAAHRSAGAGAAA